MTLDGGMVFEAGLDPYKLRPVAAEIYGTKECEFSLGTQKLRWPGPGPWALWVMWLAGSLASAPTFDLHPGEWLMLSGA